MRWQKLYNRIREYRLANNMSQSELANKIGKSKNAISAYENNLYSPDGKTALLLCKVFNCNFENLFYLGD